MFFSLPDCIGNITPFCSLHSAHPAARCLFLPMKSSVQHFVAFRLKHSESEMDGNWTARQISKVNNCRVR